MHNYLKGDKKTLLLFLLLTFLFFGISVRNEFNLDDSYVTVTNNPVPGQNYVPDNPLVAQGFKGLGKIWRSRYAHGRDGSVFDYRPVVTTSFAIEYGLYGRSFHMNHFVNLLILVCCLFLTFKLLQKCLVDYPNADAFAFVCTLFFLAHPVHTEVVNSLKSRDELFGYLFGLLCSLQVLRFIDSRKWYRVGLAAIFLILALYSKLSMISFIAVLPLMLFFFRKVPLKYLALAVAAALFVYMLQSQLKLRLLTETESRVFLHAENPLSTEHVSFATRLLFAAKTFGTYVRLLLFPFPLRFYYGTGIYHADVQLFDYEVWLGIASFLGAAYYCYRTKDRVAIFGFLFFLITISPVLNLVRPVAGVVGERLAFTPSLGFMIFCVTVIFRFTKHVSTKSVAGFFSGKPMMYVAGVLLIFLVYDWRRTAQWKDEYTLFEHDAPYVEESATANNLIARRYATLAYSQDPRYSQTDIIEKCRRHLDLAIRADSTVYEASNNAGLLALRYYNDPAKAIQYFTKAVNVQRYFPQAYENRGNCYYQLGQLENAAADYRTAIAQYARQLNSHIHLAEILIKQKRCDKAMEALQYALRVYPGNADLLRLKAECD